MVNEELRNMVEIFTEASGANSLTIERTTLMDCKYDSSVKCYRDPNECRHESTEECGYYNEIELNRSPRLRVKR